MNTDNYGSYNDKHDGILMLVNENGFCQNQEHQNKAANRAICEPVRTSTRGVLVYTYGKIEHIEAKIKNNEEMSACDENVMHGAYDQGSSPSVALFSLATESPSSSSSSSLLRSWFSIAEVHEGFQGGDDVGMCGLPLARPGAIVLDGWTPAELNDHNGA